MGLGGGTGLLGFGVSSAGRPVHALFSAHAGRRPGALAVSAADGTLTYGQLELRSDQLAHRLVALGVTADTLVAVCLERSAALVVTALGILKAGGAYVALDPSQPAERLAFMLDDAGAGVVVTRPRTAGSIESAGAHVITLEGAAGDVEGEPLQPLAPTASGNDLAYVVYTSGSTGRPKGVLVEHASLINLVEWHRRAFSLTDADRCTQIASPGFDAVVWEIWPSLTAGASVHIPPDELRTNAGALRDWLIAEGITVSFLPTALAEAIISLDWPAEASLRYLLTGGDALHRRPRPNLPFTLVNNYGPAEATVVATSGIVRGEHDAATPPTIGRPIDGVRLRIVDDQLRPVADGAVGELLIGGAGVARGYLKRPELTAERFIPDSTSGDSSARVYRTGDLVRARPDGEIEFVGRADEQVQIRGQRIELGEISATLDLHPTVRSSVVVASGVVPGQTRLVACVVLADGSGPDAEALRSHLAARLPRYMVVDEVVWLTELPMNGTDKVDRVALTELVAHRSRAAVGPSARNELEEVLVSVVAELLGLETVGIEENFFLLGGHSLLGAQLIARVGDRFGVEVSLRALFDNPTVADIATEVERLLVADLDQMSDQEAELLAGGLVHGSA